MSPSILPRRPVAPFVDTLCLCVFVLLGRESHGIDQGGAWFLIVVWPFIAGWFAAALALSVYVARSRPWERLTLTVVIGIAIALVLRATVTQRGVSFPFVLVAYGFIAALTFGWRIGAMFVSRLVRR